MRLKTKLVLSATGLTFAIVLVLSSMFVGELLRQRIEQTTAANDVLAHEVQLMTRQAVETGLRANPPLDRTDESLHAAVTDALGLTLMSTDPDTLNQQAGYRMSRGSVRDGSVGFHTRTVSGRPRVMD